MASTHSHSSHERATVTARRMFEHASTSSCSCNPRARVIYTPWTIASSTIFRVRRSSSALARELTMVHRTAQSLLDGFRSLAMVSTSISICVTCETCGSVELIHGKAENRRRTGGSSVRSHPLRPTVLMEMLSSRMSPRKKGV